jgi:protein-disulfide isomerase
MSKQFLAVIVVVILVFVGIFAFTGKSSPNASTGGSNTSTLTQHIEGQGKDGITLVEYGDYQCPFCGQYYPIVKQVQTEYNQQLYFQFRNFPLVSLHPNAFAGARAAEAAALQNKFWEMHDLLYEQNDISQSNPSASTWINASDPTSFFNEFAQQLGLNLTKFKTDYASDQVNNLINADTAKGNKLNVQGTPTFFLDGKQIQVGESAAAFEQVINAEIAKKAKSSAASTSTAPAASSGTTAQTSAH